jgi:hypothetical protein
MLKITELLIRKRATLGLLCTIGLLSIPVFGKQQPKDSSPTALVPAPIATAQKIFVSNAPGDSLPASLGGPARPYHEFYAAIKSWGHYQLASSPADADLVLEISFSNPIVGVNVMSTSGGGSTSALLLKLVIVDPKTNIPMWWFTESFGLKSGFSHRKETLDSNFHVSIAALVDDVRELVEQPSAEPTK